MSQDSTDQEPGLDAEEEVSVASLLQVVGSRPAPGADGAADVRAAVEAEWRATVAARRRKRNLTALATAAGLAVAAFAVWLARPALEPTPVSVASIARAVGDVQQSEGDGRWTPLATGGAIVAGAQLRTAAGARAALRLEDGIEVRLDSRSLVAFDDASHATLSRGAVYVDAGRTTGRAAGNFLLDTPAGSVRHLGTQYEARLEGGVLRLGVREGRVRLTGRAGDQLVSAGERLTVTDSRASRDRVSPSAADWSWLSAVTPPYSIEGRNVEEFLVWAARETGRTIVYVTPEAGSQARAITLSGTVEGLSPDEAVMAVLSTTSLRPEIGTEHIRIGAVGQ